MLKQDYLLGSTERRYLHGPMLTSNLNAIPFLLSQQSATFFTHLIYPPPQNDVLDPSVSDCTLTSYPPQSYLHFWVAHGVFPLCQDLQCAWCTYEVDWRYQRLSDEWVYTRDRVVQFSEYFE